MSISNYVLTKLSEHPEYYDEVIALIEKEFHYKSSNHYEIDFLPLMQTSNFENCYLYIETESNTVVSHLAISKRELVKNNLSLKVIFIGGIVTHREHRGKNLFRELLENALKETKEEAALYFLWSDLENIYEKFSFFRTGGFIETGKRNFTSEEKPIGFIKTSFDQISESDLEDIKLLYKNLNERIFFTVTRNETDWATIKEMSSVDLYIKRNSHGKLSKYFCVNKGQDLTNIIHEFSCHENDLSKIIDNLASFKLWIPETLKNNVLNKEIYYTAFTKLGSVKLLSEFTEKLSGGGLCILKHDDSLVTFTFDKKEFSVSDKDFLQYLLGPNPLEEFSHFNLSPFISGLDSV